MYFKDKNQMADSLFYWVCHLVMIQRESCIKKTNIKCATHSKNALNTFHLLQQTIKLDFSRTLLGPYRHKLSSAFERPKTSTPVETTNPKRRQRLFLPTEALMSLGQATIADGSCQNAINEHTSLQERAYSRRGPASRYPC